MKTTLLALAASTVLAATAAPSFENDANHTMIGFKASSLLFDVPGRFDKYKVEVAGNPDTLEGASVRIEIDASSIDTGNEQRDRHLRSEDFFDVKKHPSIVFTSTSVKRSGEKIVVAGTLQMHGQKQELVIPFDVVAGLNGAGHKEHVFKANPVIKRAPFGIGADSVAAKISLKDDVELQLLLAGFFEEPKAAPRAGH